MGGAAAPPNPPATFYVFFTGIDMASYLNHHHFFDPVTQFVGDARDVGGTCGVYFARTCCKIRHFTGPAEIELHPCLNHHFFERPISRENAAKYDFLGNLCSPCMFVPGSSIGTFFSATCFFCPVQMMHARRSNMCPFPQKVFEGGYVTRIHTDRPQRAPGQELRDFLQPPRGKVRPSAGAFKQPNPD